MPIAVHVVSESEFNAWVEACKEEVRRDRRARTVTAANLRRRAMTHVTGPDGRRSGRPK